MGEGRALSSAPSPPKGERPPPTSFFSIWGEAKLFFGLPPHLFFLSGEDRVPSPGTRKPNLARSELGMVMVSGTDSRPFGAVVAMLYPAMLSNLGGGVAGAGARPPQNGRPRFISDHRDQ